MSQAKNVRAIYAKLGAPYLNIGFQSRFYAPLGHCLQEMHLILSSACLTVYSLAMQAEYSPLTSLRILSVPMQAWFSWLSCRSKLHSGLSVDGPRWDIDATLDFNIHLPPDLEDLKIDFRYPNCIFASGQQHLTKISAGLVQLPLSVFDWLLRLLRHKSMRTVALRETPQSPHRHSWIKLPNERGYEDSILYTPPETISNAFKDVGVELEIHMLDFGTVAA